MTAAPPLPTPAVALDHATFRHPGGHGVDDVTLAVAPGEVLGLLGPNGAGKSTILALVAGGLRPQSGRVSLFDAPLSPASRRRLGVLFQDGSLDPLMTARETLWMHGRLFGLGRRALGPRLDALLAAVGLTDRAADPVETLSGGMKRRLDLARAVLHAPGVLLLDEPSLGLDPDSRARLWGLLARLHASGAALLVATNDVAEAERHCDRVALIDQGRIVAQGTPADLKRSLRRDAVTVEWPQAPASAAPTIAAWPGVGRVTTAAPVLHATVDNASAFVPELFRLAGGGIRAIRIHESTLEDAYFQIVGAPLHPAGARNGAAAPVHAADPALVPAATMEGSA